MGDFQLGITMQVPFGPKVRLGWVIGTYAYASCKRCCGASKDFEGVWLG